MPPPVIRFCPIILTCCCVYIAYHSVMSVLFYKNDACFSCSEFDYNNSNAYLSNWFDLLYSSYRQPALIHGGLWLVTDVFLNNTVNVYRVTQIRISCSAMLIVSCLYYRYIYRYTVIYDVQWRYSAITL